MYQNAKQDLLCGTEIIVNGIKYGIPLPKGHGRLIDADEIERTHKGDNWDLHRVLEKAPVVIEADKEN